MRTIEVVLDMGGFEKTFAVDVKLDVSLREKFIGIYSWKLQVFHKLTEKQIYKIENTIEKWLDENGATIFQDEFDEMNSGHYEGDL